MKTKEFTLEISLKPFLRKNAASKSDVCRELFMQWLPATKDSETASVMLWTSDGSEILEFNGNLLQTFDWSRYIGIMNREQTPEQKELDPNCRDAWIGHLFEEDSEIIDYHVLKSIVTTLKEVGQKICQKPVRVGTAFDPGPEFSVSDFKYKTHPEICKGSFGGMKEEVVSCYAELNVDSANYAAFPDGIPQGTPFGRFLGKQLNCFLKAMEMDFIWLSNGFGFGNFPWNYPGVLYDEQAFYPEKGVQVTEQMLLFWNEFKKACNYPVYVRGSNLSTGRDLACDGVPLKEIYQGEYMMAPPVNSPWVPLNLDFGSEMAGWMSHLCGFPKDDYTYRLYVNDPWFQTEPWLRNYEQEPYDIYLPLSVSRLNSKNEVINPSRINILTVDNCRGDLTQDATEAVIPHLACAKKHAPDVPGPFVWLYPFSEYHNWIKPDIGRIEEVFAGDHFMRDAINKGLPLNTVVNVDDCQQLPSGRIVITPVPEADSHWERLVTDHLEGGGNVLLYGSLEKAGKTILDLLEIEFDKALEGKLAIQGVDLPECFAPQFQINHKSLISAGGITEKNGKIPLVTVYAGTDIRTIAAEASYASGKLVWLRISSPRCHAFSVKDEYEGKNEREPVFEPAELMRNLLSRFGWKYSYKRQSKANWIPYNTLSMSNNAFFFSGYNLSTTTEHVQNTPFGAPALLGTDFELCDGCAVYRQPKSWHHECRIFINQQKNSFVSCHETTSKLRGIDRWIFLRGLDHAQLNIFVEPGAEQTLEIQLNPREGTYTCPEKIPFTLVNENGYTYCRVDKALSGTVLVCW